MSRHQRPRPEIVAARAESDRLRGLFLRYVGKRRDSECLAEFGISRGHGRDWLAGDCILADEHQRTVRARLDAAGVAPSPCG